MPDPAGMGKYLSHTQFMLIWRGGSKEIQNQNQRGFKASRNAELEKAQTTFLNNKKQT